jgi:sodium-dependent dicarboxylate transporter 2/3/5
MTRGTEFVVDTRPLWIVLLSRIRDMWMLLAGGLIYWWIVSMDTPAGLSETGQKALAAFAMCVSYWVSGALPLMITGLLAIILIPLSGVMPASKAYSLFGNEAVFFILGAFILAACVMKSGLSRRLALYILSRFGTTPRRLLVTILVLNAIMSFFMSEHAVAAMNFPIVVEIAAVLGLQPRRSSYGKALFLAMAWGTTIGGIGTLLGGGRAPLALGILRETTGQSYSFAAWSVAIMPLVFVLLFVCYFVITRFHPIDIDSVQAADDALNARIRGLGRMTYEERAIGGVVILTVAAWIIGGEEFGLANIALASVVALFALQLVSWRDIEAYVNWGVILMYGGAICLGAAVNQSGAATWLAQTTVSRLAGEGWTLVMIVSGLSILLTEAMSNSAVVALLMPVSLGIAAEFGIEPGIMAFVVAVPAGLAYTLPIGTPANAIAYSSGHLTIRNLAVPGAVLTLISWVLFNIMANLYWPLLGMSIEGGA